MAGTCRNGKLYGERERDRQKESKKTKNKGTKRDRERRRKENVSQCPKGCFAELLFLCFACPGVIVARLQATTMATVLFVVVLPLGHREGSLSHSVCPVSFLPRFLRRMEYDIVEREREKTTEMRSLGPCLFFFSSSFCGNEGKVRWER